MNSYKEVVNVYGTVSLSKIVIFLFPFFTFHCAVTFLSPAFCRFIIIPVASLRPLSFQFRFLVGYSSFFFC